MSEPRVIPLQDLQPSQLYVSSAKLAAVEVRWDAAALEPLPVREYGGRLVLTDGHSRAVAALRAGLENVPVIRDDDELDDEAYEICVGWCLEEEVRSVVELADRIVDAEAFERLWLERCRRMHEHLAARRDGTGDSPAQRCSK